MRNGGIESFFSNLETNNDRDHDGLTDAMEITLGTGLSKPDTDGDGLKDGEEYRFGTNPLKADTDGDGYKDLMETQRHSDPLDPAALPPMQLSIQYTGNGGGSVVLDPPGTSCTGTCILEYQPGSTVNLMAVIDSNSIFNGWSGGGCSGAVNCTTVINSDTTISAAFMASQPARVYGSSVSYFQTLAGAYAALPPLAKGLIQARAVDFVENLLFNNNVPVILRGGYDSSYTGNSGSTRLKGTLTIGNGSLTVENLVVW